MHLDRRPRLMKFCCIIILYRFGRELVTRTEEFREVVHLGGLSLMDSVQVLTERKGNNIKGWCSARSAKHMIVPSINLRSSVRELNICILQSYNAHFYSGRLHKKSLGIHEAKCCTGVHPDLTQRPPHRVVR
jgi:hypothetical protein